jgi:hypothetical protein
MSGFRFGRVWSWLALAMLGIVAAVYFWDPSRRAALTQSAGWFITAARFVLSGSG